MTLPSRLANRLSAVSCLSCEELFRLPEDADVDAEIECPHCQKTLLVQDLIDHLVPQAKVKNRGAAPKIDVKNEETPARTTFDDQDYVIPKPLKTAVRRPSRKEAKKGRARHQRDEKERRESYQRTKGKGDWPRTIIGGIAAIPVAQLVLWWAFLADPLDLAPRVSAFAPLLVPAKLRPVEPVAEPDAPVAETDLPGDQVLHDKDMVPDPVVKTIPD